MIRGSIYYLTSGSHTVGRAYGANTMVNKDRSEISNLTGCKLNKSCERKRNLYETIEARNRSLKEIVQDLEREILSGAIEVHGSMAKVAEVLKIDRSTIFRKLKRDEPS